MVTINDTIDEDNDLTSDISSDSFSGWRGGVSLNTAFASVVLLINIVFLSWATIRYGTVGGLGTLYRGDCEKVERIALFAHLIINVLSSLMLAASNYMMQVLAAPTRAEVDKAHNAHTTIQIGIQSLRNLQHIGAKRIVLWIILGISSIPLHLL